MVRLQLSGFNPFTNPLYLGGGKPETFGGNPGDIAPGIPPTDLTPAPTTNNTGNTLPPWHPDPLQGYPLTDPYSNPLHTGNTHPPDNLFIPVLNADHFITTPNGITLPPNQDFNLVPTHPGGAMPNKADEKWFQIHGTHEHNGMDPHTHYPEINISPTGKGNTQRRDTPTSDIDIDRANDALQSGEMRLRANRKDKGDTP